MSIAYSSDQERLGIRPASDDHGTRAPNRLCSVLHLCLVVGLVTTIIQAQPAASDCTDGNGYPAQEGVHCWNDYTHLMDLLMDPARKDRTFRMVQPRNGQPTPMARHNQYNSACFFFTVAPIIEYLGYSRFEQGASWRDGMVYLTASGLHTYNFDVGYQGSAEDLINLYYTYESIFRGLLGGEGTSIYPAGFLSGGALDTSNVSCNALTWGWYPYFETGQEYGQCRFMTNFPEFLNHSQGGFDGTLCEGRYDDYCGMYNFMNEVLPNQTRLAGFSDARNFDTHPGGNVDPSSVTEINHMRRIIKAFIDNDVPLLATVNRGGHFMPIVGYADLDANRLPETAILADSVLRVYWTVDLLNWDQNDRWSLRSIAPWNQHFNGGCQAGGWASGLDRRLPNKYKICQIYEDGDLVEDWPVERGATPYYGIRLTCEKSGTQREFYSSVEDPFITVSDNIDCDRVTLRYVDGENAVTWARINRYRYDSSSETWGRISRWVSDEVTNRPPPAGRVGSRNEIVWDAASETWRDNYWLVAQRLSGSYPKRRTTIELRLDNGEIRRIEVAPPATYGISTRCVDVDGDTERTTWIRASDAVKDVFAVDRPDHNDHMIIEERRDRSCDVIEVEVSLGYGNEVTGAEIQRYYYGAYGEWRRANAAWEPDLSERVYNGLSGRSYRFTWDGSWRDNFWLVASDVGSGDSRGDRKTDIRLLDNGGRVVRELEVVPYY